MVEDFDYTEGEALHLAEGDMLLAYTDGVVEARHAARPDRLFDESGVRAMFAELAREQSSACELTEALVKSVLEFAGGTREDDMTVVAVRRTKA